SARSGSCGASDPGGARRHEGGEHDHRRGNALGRGVHDARAGRPARGVRLPGSDGRRHRGTCLQPGGDPARPAAAVHARDAAGAAAGGAMMLGLGEQALALWFLLGMSFAAAGIASTLRRLPPDHVFASQLFFHASFLIPIVAALLAWLVDWMVADTEWERPLA